jgi:GDP-L-fucose synthase
MVEGGTMAFWTDKRVLVTGGSGFLGSHVVETLETRGCTHIFVPRSRDYDLTDIEDVEAAYLKHRPQIVIHLAARVGGIGANKATPGEFFYDNLMMGVQMMEIGRQWGVEKFVAIGTICAYPKHTPVPFKEKHLWDGYPEETNAAYGLAKKMLLVQAQAYREQYGFNAIYLLPVNLYGPRDNFDLETSHVIPAMIRKLVEAKENGDSEIQAWGSGTVTREFLYVKDAAEGIVMAAERYNSPQPVNLGSGREIRIKGLVDLLASLVGFTGHVRWDHSRPDGQPRRQLDTSKALREFGFEARTPLSVGLVQTIDWYIKNRECAFAS